jgi:protein TonB
MRDPKLFASCLVDGDADAIARFSRQRRKAFLSSVAVELGALVALLLCPLLAPGKLARRFSVTPSPPYRPESAPPTNAPSTAKPPRGQDQETFHNIDFLPKAPKHVAPETDAGSGNPAAPSIDGNGPGSLDGIGMPGGTTPAPPTIRPPAVKNPPGPHLLLRTSEVQAAALVYRVDPAYPEIAKQMRLAGIVQLHAVIATDGHVRRLELISGHPILAEAAKQAVQQWRYRPTILNGEPVEVETTVIVNFVLSK